MLDIQEVDYAIKHAMEKREMLKRSIEETKDKIVSLNIEKEKKSLKEDLEKFAHRPVMLT